LTAEGISARCADEVDVAIERGLEGEGVFQLFLSLYLPLDLSLDVLAR
jgi:hypothetical protein